MSEHKKKIILAIVLASVLVILLGGVSLTFFPVQPTHSASPPNVAPIPVGGTAPAGGAAAAGGTTAAGGSSGAPAILLIPVESTVELNSSEGFNSSTVANLYSPSSPLFVLPPGGNGSVPFLVYLSDANETVNVSLSVSLSVNTDSPEKESDGVTFSVSPSNFTLSPGQQVTSVLTITANNDAPSAFYLPTVEMQTNSPYIVGGSIDVPDLLVSNSTPSCLFLVNSEEISPPVVIAPSTPSGGIVNASVSAPPPTTTTPIMNASIGSSGSALSAPPGISGLPFAPTIDMVPGEEATVLFGCYTQGPLSLNVTAPAGFSSEFSPNPLDTIFNGGSGNMYALTVTADPNLSSGTYEVDTTGSLGSYQFDASFAVTIT